MMDICTEAEYNLVKHFESCEHYLTIHRSYNATYDQLFWLSNYPIETHSVLMTLLCKGITLREADVLWLVAQGYDYRIAAKQLKVKVSTVKTHIHRLLTKLNVPDRTSLALLAVGYGLVTPDVLKEKFASAA